MAENVMVSLASIFIFGIGAQWLAWRFNLPSILLMLLFGFIAGPIGGIINPNSLLGDLLFPIVSLSVAIILFEGGLSLRLDELRPVRRAVFNLVTIGAVVTWLLSALAAYYILNLDYRLSLLFGAILVVSGPTVIIPLLVQVRPIGQTGSVVKWEGIVNDPVGAILAVLVFEALVAQGVQEAQTQVISSLITTILLGTAFGLLGAVIIIVLLKYYLVPDFLHNPVTLMTVIGFFVASDIFQVESGLFTVTVMGIIIANQKYVSIDHIIHFKENLRVLLISVLFITLAARLEFSDFTDINFFSFIGFCLILLFVVRPLSVLASTFNTDLAMNEKMFLAWMAPRGIVAAAVASIFALELEHAGYSEAWRLAPLTFMVIIATVGVYGLTAMPVGQWLKVAQPDPQGAIIAGAHPWAIMLGKLLKEAGYRVMLIDINRENVETARQAGLTTVQGNIASDYVRDRIDLVGIGRLLALTSNDEVNALATRHFTEIFGRAEVYQLPPHGSHAEAVAAPLSGRQLFHPGATYGELTRRFDEGATFKKIDLTKDFGFTEFEEFYDSEALPLFLIEASGKLHLFTTGDQNFTPDVGDKVIALVTPSTEEAATS